MNVYALAVQVLKLSIESSSREFRLYFSDFFDGMHKTFQPQNQTGWIVRYCDVEFDLGGLGKALKFQGAFDAVGAELASELKSTFVSFFADDSRERTYDVAGMLGVAGLEENENIGNSRFVGFLNKFLTRDPFVPDGDEEQAAVSLFEGMRKVIERVYASKAYIGIEGMLTGSAGTAKIAADNLAFLMGTVLKGLGYVRASYGAGKASSSGAKAQSSQTIDSTVYQLTLEEIPMTADQPMQTFAQAFQDVVYDFGQLTQQTKILRTDRVAIQATLENKGVEEAIYYKNGGPVTYWRLGGLIRL